MADCEYSVPDMYLSGDKLYGAAWACRQEYVDWFWDSYNFDYNWWQDGWGYDDCCNTTKPLARAFNGLYCLNYSSGDPRNDEWNDNFLFWGGRYARERMDGYALRATCGAKIATTFGAGCTSYRTEVLESCKEWEQKQECGDWHWLFSGICLLWRWISTGVCKLWGYVASGVCAIGNEVITDKRIELYLDFFYASSKHVPGRASTFVHESRHIDGKPHLADFPPGSGFGGGAGADTDWAYDGAWKWQACWLSWYWAAARGSTPALRARARDECNFILQNAFATNPGIVV